MAEGQSVRWWQESEEQSQVSQRAGERVGPAPAPLVPVPLVAALPAEVALSTAVTLDEEYQDTWEDLEAEAVRRAQQAKVEDAESISFFTEKTAALVRHRRDGRIMGWTFGTLILLVFLVPLIFLLTDHHHHSPPPFGMIGGFAGVFSMFYRRRKWLEDNENPTLRLSPQGLFINTAMQTNTTLPWNEIEEITAKGKPKKRHLEIRASKKRKFVIEERDLPIAADALAARIAVYETGRLAA